MQTKQDLNFSQLTRREKLRVWMSRNDQNLKTIGRALGVSNVAVHYWFRNGAPLERINQLKALGVPDYALPETNK